MDFVHLHVHTEYSLLDGLSKINKLIDRTISHGQTALAITDHGVMYGVVHFYNACLQQGIKPILGVEIYFAENSRFDKQTRMGQDQSHLTLLAKNDLGYHHLMKLVTLAHLEGYSYKPRIDLALLETYHEGIIALSGCASGIIPKKILAHEDHLAVKWLKHFQDIFGADFYLEIQSHPNLEAVETVRPKLVALSKQYGVPLVATNDVHYVDQSDAEAQDALLAIATRKTLDDPNRLSMLDSPDFYLKSNQEMFDALGDYQEALANTIKIASSCQVTIPTGKMIFPKFPLPPEETPESALRKLAYERLNERFPQADKNVTDRLDYELHVISTKGYASYFLIVQDFVNWAKNRGIRVGPGRGSAAGSLVSYVLRITSIDPLQHNLPFERFMNPERPSPPDIDIDIADVSRDDVIRYVSNKYGEDHVAQIITFGTMEARAAIRDIGRVLGLPYSEPDKIAKAIPLGYTLEQAMTSTLELQEFYKEPIYKKLLDLAKKVEGNSRHASVHAAGVIIADKPLTDYTPLQIESKGGKVVTQYDMYALDLNISENAIGLLKMDFLGLRNLSILGKAIEYIKVTRNDTVDLSRIPLDDPKVYTMLSSGETTGVFQLESAGMRRVARSLKPARFSDITAMVALYRPGPMELIDTFIAGKANPNKIIYPHYDLKPVLEETYGIPVYQEQVLQIANVFAGYSLGEADILRRAIGKKKRSILDKEKKRFIDGAKKKDYPAKKAEEIWAFIDKFAGYGFNKAHSASYAMIAYQTAYLKVNYPVEYMCALLSIETQARSATREDKIYQAIDECRRMGITLLPPDINFSMAGFSIEKFSGSLNNQAIRFGLSAIKNVGENSIEAIVTARAPQPFSGLTDFIQRVDTRKVNKKVLESLLKVGAFDTFGTRSALLVLMTELKNNQISKQKSQESGQDSLFSTQKLETASPQDKVPNVPDMLPQEKLLHEKELLGVYLSSHPFTPLLNQLDLKQYTRIIDLDPTLPKATQNIAGLITRLREVQTKKSNALMAFLTLEDQTATVEVVLFPKIYEQAKTFIRLNQAVIIKGKLETRDNALSFLAESVKIIEPSAPTAASLTKTIRLDRNLTKNSLKKIGDLLKANPGDDEVTIILGQHADAPSLILPYKVNLTKTLQKTIQDVVETSLGKVK